MGQFSVQESKEVLSLVVALYKAGSKSLADGKLDLSDAANLLALLPKVGPAFADLSKIPLELKDLDAQDAADLVAHVASELGQDNAKAAQVASAGLKLVFDVVDFVKVLKA